MATGVNYFQIARCSGKKCDPWKWSRLSILQLLRILPRYWERKMASAADRSTKASSGLRTWLLAKAALCGTHINELLVRGLWVLTAWVKGENFMSSWLGTAFKTNNISSNFSLARYLKLLMLSKFRDQLNGFLVEHERTIRPVSGSLRFGLTFFINKVERNGMWPVKAGKY